MGLRFKTYGLGVQVGASLRSRIQGDWVEALLGLMVYVEDLGCSSFWHKHKQNLTT